MTCGEATMTCSGSYNNLSLAAVEFVAHIVVFLLAEEFQFCKLAEIVVVDVESDYPAFLAAQLPGFHGLSRLVVCFKFAAVVSAERIQMSEND